MFLGEYGDRQVAIKAVFGEKKLGGALSAADHRDLDEDGQDKREKMVQVCGSMGLLSLFNPTSRTPTCLPFALI